MLHQVGPGGQRRQSSVDTGACAMVSCRSFLYEMDAHLYHRPPSNPTCQRIMQHSYTYRRSTFFICEAVKIKILIQTNGNRNRESLDKASTNVQIKNMGINFGECESTESTKMVSLVGHILFVNNIHKCIVFVYFLTPPLLTK